MSLASAAKRALPRLSRNLSEVSWQIVVRKSQGRRRAGPRGRAPCTATGKIIASTPEQYEKPDAHTLRFEVTAPKNGEVKIGYRVRVKS